MSLSPWSSFDFGPSTISEKVAYALAELGFDPEDSDVHDAGNLFTARDLLSSGYTALEEQERRDLEEMKPRGAEAERVAAPKETTRLGRVAALE